MTDMDTFLGIIAIAALAIGAWASITNRKDRP